MPFFSLMQSFWVEKFYFLVNLISLRHSYKYNSIGFHSISQTGTNQLFMTLSCVNCEPFTQSFWFL